MCRAVSQSGKSGQFLSTMSDAFPTLPEDARREPPAPRTAEIAAYLAARMCHDFISPVSAMVSGLDLLDDPSAQDLREDAMGLISASARKLADQLGFFRVAFGASASAEVFDSRELGRLAEGLFRHIRAELDWQVATPALPKPAARALLNLSQLAGAALPTGGAARIQAEEREGFILIRARAEGARARLRAEVSDGLAGLPMGEGLHGYWVQAYYVHLFVTDAGGTVRVDSGPGTIDFLAALPA
jgi:histidine phosphotransferase ChpT